MKTPATVAKEVRVYVFDRLQPRGFTRRDIFLLRQREHGIHDWIALPHVVHAKNGPVLVTANVGLYVEPVHALLEEDVTATFCRNVGYFSPAMTYASWPFDREAFSEESARELFGTLVSYGLPVMEAFSTYDQVIAGCERFGLKHLNVSRVPALRLLAGQREEAVSAIQTSLREFEGKADAYSEHQAAVVNALLTYAKKG